MITRNMMAAAGLGLVALALPLFGQGQPAGQPRAGGPAAIRERLMGAMKDAIECTDEQWKEIEPKLVKAILLKLDLGEWNLSFGDGGRSRMIGFIRTMLDPNALPSDAEQRQGELEQMIQQKETSTDAYKDKMVQLRQARKQAREQLDKVEKSLDSLLTVRQVAALVEIGVLD
jgi:hypothetical protein